ncbi:copper-transporting ATPase [Plasmodium sp. DRC-Itaito]|nr:copper-transporting ATPase [Plasmodium sp. DRC-Itaito]
MAKLSLTINNVDDNFKRKIKKAKFEGVEDLKLKNRKLTISYNPKVVDSYGVIERIKHLDINGDILKDDTDISSKKGSSFIFSMYKEEIEEENVVKKTNIFDNNENMQNIHNNMDNNNNDNNNLYGVNDRDNYDKMNYNNNNEDNNFDQIYDINNRVNNYSYPNGEDLYEQLDNAYDNKNYEENYQNYEVSSQNYKDYYQSYQVSSQTYKDNYQNYKDNYQNYKENYQNYKDNYQNHDENYKPHGEDYQNCNVSEKNENINSNYNSTNNKGDLYDINYYPNQVEKVEESEGVEENRKSSKFSVLNLFNNIKKAKDKKKMKKEVKKDYLNEDYNNLDKSILLSNDMYKDVENKTYNNSNDIYNSNNNYYYDYNEDKLKKKNFNFRDYESYRDKKNIYICELKIYNMTCDNCGKKIINFLKDKKLILEGNSYATENKIKLKIDISSDIIPCNNNVKMFVNTIMNEIKESGFNNDLLDLYKDDKNRCNLSEITLYIYRDDIIKSYKLLKDIKGISNVEYDLKKEYIYFLYDPELVGIRYILEILKKKKNVDAYYDEDKEKYFRSSQNNETNNTWKLIELSICIFISIIIIVLNNYQMNMGSMNSFYSYTKNIFNNSNKINKDNIKHPSIYNNIGKGTIVDQPTLDIYFEKVKNQEMLNEYINKNRRRDGKGTFFINSNFKFNKKNKDSDVNRKLVNDNIKKGQILSDKENQSMEYNNTVNMVSEQVNTSHYNNQEDHKDYPLDNGNNVSKYIEHTNSENMRKNYLLNEKDDDDDNNKEQNLNNNNCKKDNFNNGYNKDDYYDEEHYDLIPIDDFKQNDISEKHPDNKKGDNTKNAYSRFRKHDNTNIKNKNNMNDSDGNKEDNNIDGIYILKQKDNKRQVIKGDEENKDNFTLKGEERNDEKVETEMSNNFLNNEEKSDNKKSNEKNDKYYNYLKKKEKKHDSSNDEYNTNDKFLEKKERKEENNENSENMESVGILKKKENNVDSENKESASLLKKNDEKVIENTNDANNIGDIVLKKREKNEENNENSENMENVSLLKKKENEDNENTNDVNNVGDIILKKKQRKDDIKENGENMESASLLKKKEKKDDNKENGENMEGASLLKKKEKKDDNKENGENMEGASLLKKKEKKDDNKENGENMEGASLLKKKEKKDNENMNDENNVGDIVLKKNERKDDNKENGENMESAILLKKKEKKENENMNDENNVGDMVLKKKEKKDNENMNDENNVGDMILKKKEKKDDNKENGENVEGASLLKKKEKKENENMNDENNVGDMVLKKKEKKDDNKENGENVEGASLLKKKEKKDNENMNDENNVGDMVLKKKEKKDNENTNDANNVGDIVLKKKERKEENNEDEENKDNKNTNEGNNVGDHFLNKKEKKNDNNEDSENMESASLLKKKEKKDNENINDENNESDHFLKKKEEEYNNSPNEKNEENENFLKKKENADNKNTNSQDKQNVILVKNKKKKDDKNSKEENDESDNFLKKKVKTEDKNTNDQHKQDDIFLKNKQNEHVKSSHGQNNQNDDTFLKKKKIKDENDNSKEGENVSVLMLCKKEDGNKSTNKKCDTNNSNDTIDEGNLLVSKEGDDKDNHDVKHSKNEQNENNSYDETEEDNCLMKKKKKKDENNTKDEKENIDVRKNKNIEINNEENNDTYKNEKNFMNKNNTYNNSHKNEENEESHFSFNTLFYKLANYSIYLDMDKKIVQSSSLRLFFIFVLSSFIYIYYGFSFVMNGYKNLKNNMINMNVLISISSSFSYFYSLLLLLFCLIFSIDINGIPLYFDSSALLICIMKFGCEIENFLVSFSKKKMEDLYESTAKNVYILEKKNRYNQEEEGKFNSNIKIKSMSNISKVYGKDNNSNSIIGNNQKNSNDIVQSVGKEIIKVDTLKSNLSFSTSSFFLSNQFLYEDEEINKILSEDMDININDYNINSYPVQFIQKNDILIFYEGATLLIDGIKINKGISCVDESMISGEKNAIKKYKGDKVYAGSKCVEGVVIIYVKDISKGNYIEYVKKTLDEINCKKTNLQLYADKIASIFIPFILILCIVVFFIWFILTFFDIVNIRKENYFKLNRFLSCVFFSVHFSLSILCVACPCAVGLASPLSIAISSYICSSIGIIIKNINIFEIFLECKHFIFDKTGTLTVGKPVVNKIYISNNIDLFIDQLLKNKSRNNLSVSFNDNKNSNMPALDRVKNDEKKAKKMNNNMKENLNNLYSTVYSINDQPSNGYHRYVDNLDEQGLEVDKNMMKNNTLNFVEKFSCSNKNVSFYSFTTEKEYFKIEIKKTSRNKDKVKKKKKNIKNETRNNYDGSSLNGYKNYEDDQNDKNVSNSCMNENKSILNSIVSFITDNNKKNKYNKILDNTLKEHFINNSDNYFSSNDDSYYSETTSNENEYNKYNNIRGSNNIMDGNDNLENMSSPLEEENSYMEKSSNWLYLFLSLSLNIEKYSNHLFATSINTYINNNFSINEVFDVNNLKNEKNQGISCIINDLTITIGTLFFCYTKYKNIYCNKVPIVEEKLTVKSMERHIYSCDCNVHKTYQYLYSYSNSKKNESNNIIFMCIEGIVVGFYTLVDNIKPEVFELINFLKREKKNVYVCTGDNYMNALYISKILGIRKENVSSNTLPLEKVQFVKKVQSMNDGKVCMIGDGINDCFALKTADLGLSLCTRTNVVMDSADACIVDNNINVIIKLFEISRKTLLVIKFNFLFSFFINIFFILLASGAFYSLNYVFSPFLFTFLMFCSSIIVILSSLSLKLLLKDI